MEMLSTADFWHEIAVTIAASMMPVSELRGGLPVGVGLGLTVYDALLAAVLGNMIPIPFLLLFMRRILTWLKSYEKPGEWARKLEEKGHLKGKKMTRYGSLGLMLFVAVPLPGTGAWTGALIAAVLDMDFKKSLLSIFAGVCIAGLIVACITYGFVSLM
jgi:Predicted membrane protein